MSEDKIANNNKSSNSIDKNEEVMYSKSKQEGQIKSENKISIKKIKQIKSNNIIKIVAISLVGIMCFGVWFSYGKM